MSDYTPTTEEIIEEWTDGSVDVPESRKQFFRWLAEHDRQVAEEAWDAGRDSAHWVDFEGRFDDNPYRKEIGK